MAGTVGARTNNNIGVAGVAGGDGTGGSGVRLMSCQIFGGKMKVGVAHGLCTTVPIMVQSSGPNSWGYVLKANITAIPRTGRD